MKRFGRKSGFTLAEETCPPLEGGPKSLISRRGKSLCRSALCGQAESCGNEGKKIGRLEDRQVTFKPVNSLPSYPPTFQPSKNAAFTLAEVLITLAIIGVVAALTIPTLITAINNKIDANRQKVIEKRFIQGLNLYNNLDNGLSGKHHSSSADFVRGLSKHFKVIQICEAEELDKCFPYDAINYINEGENEQAALTDIKTAGNLNLPEDEYLAPAGFITAAGVPYIISIKNNCMEDPDVPMKSVSTCVAGLYDLNGAQMTNTLGNDIKSFGGASISIEKEDPLWKTITLDSGAEVKVLKTPLSAEWFDCRSNRVSDYCNLGSTTGFTDGVGSNIPYDYWAGARKACDTVGGTLPELSTYEEIKNKAGISDKFWVLSHSGHSYNGVYDYPDSQYNGACPYNHRAKISDGTIEVKSNSSIKTICVIY